MEQFFNCSISGQPCAFQRYCPKEEDVINTDGSEKCLAKSRQKRNKKEYEFEPFTSIQESNKVGTVTLVARNYIVYELDGKSICLRGKYKYAVGDKIEI